MTYVVPLSAANIPTEFDSAFRDNWYDQMAQAIVDAQTGVIREQATFHIVGLTDKTYTLEMNSRYPYTIEDITCKTDAGTCTVAVKINGTNVTSLSAVAVTSTEATTAATAANTVAIGADVTLVVSSVTGASDLIINVWNNRTGLGTA